MNLNIACVDLVRNSVEDSLNTLLDHEAEKLVNVEKYEHSVERKGYRRREIYGGII